jgi:hypothetical protein
VVRFSTDGRTGNYPIKFDDQRTIIFSTNATGSYYPAIGLLSGSIWLSDPDASDINAISGSILVTGSVRPALVDDLPFVGFVSGVALTPFRDNDHPAVDGKTSNASFYTTGSSVANVGEGFSSPLWSKQKIEINLGVVIPSSLSLASASAGASGSSYPMAYYNFASQYWEPIGTGHVVNAFAGAADTADNMMAGFLNGFIPGGNTFYHVNTMGFVTSDFGFPYHAKYHATSSQALSLQNYITRPFVLEKAVVEVSGTWAVGGVNTTAYGLVTRQPITASTNTCFILNQRRNQSFSYYKQVPNEGSTPGTVLITASIPTNRRLSLNAAPVRVDTIRDLVGFGQVYSFGLDAYTKTITQGAETSTPSRQIPLTENDVVLTSLTTGISGANWTQLIRLSMSMNTPAATTSPVADIITRFGTGANYDDLVVGYDGYRTGLGMANISTRGLTNDFFSTPKRRTDTLVGTTIIVPTAKYKVNPYILLPEDQLIIGWQLPISSNPGQLIRPNQAESSFTFHTGSFKLVLYGSYMTEGREENETTNQLLSSNTIHEVIG